MSVTAAMVKELRELTGSGMMECKRALVESNGDINAAIEAMRKAGQAKAVKKASRTAAEGIVSVVVSADHRQALMLEVNSETDFVAREERFRHFVKMAASQALSAGLDDVAGLANLAQSQDNETTIEEARLGLIAQLGENIHLRRLLRAQTEQGTVAAYGHTDSSGMTRIAALVELDIDNPELAYSLAMHVAAMNPEVLSPTDIDAARMDKEREIVRSQTHEENPGKSDEMLAKIVEGRLKKFTNEISLLGQAYVREPSMSIDKLLSQAGAKVLSFKRFEVGEGIEKQADNFVAEVMAQVQAGS